MTFAALSEYVAGKSVALIGGNKPTWEYFEGNARDLICGVHNHAEIVTPQIVFAGFEVPKLSGATEWVIYNTAYEKFSEVDGLMDRSGAKPFLYDSNTYRDRSPLGPEYEWHNAFTKELNALPFTGISAMKLLLMMPIVELFVTGFTFYANDEGQFPYRVNAHFVEPQVEWFRRTVETDARVTLDSTLKLLFLPRVKGPAECVRCRTDEFGYLWRV